MSMYRVVSQNQFLQKEHLTIIIKNYFSLENLIFPDECEGFFLRVELGEWASRDAWARMRIFPLNRKSVLSSECKEDWLLG